MKHISVIIPDHNSPVIDQTICALGEQTYSHGQYEIIISGTDSFEMVKDDSGLTFISSEASLNPAEARNLGAKHANGEILVFTDADCIPLPNWLDVIAKRFEDPDLNVLGGSINIGNQNYCTICDNLNMIHDFLPVHSPGTRSNLAGGNMAVRRSVFENEGGFDERARPFGEDTEICYRLRKRGYVLFFEPEAIVVHIPKPRNLRDLIWRSYNQGKYSSKFDRRYVKQSNLPGWLYQRLILLLLSPILAVGATIRIYFNRSILVRYWNTIPIILLMKLLWCFGAVNRPSPSD